ncbi:phosphoethanolamine transferase [Eleftheria terrae]|uniref:phosphoethanolamine transferase n=1 Tax=Eleftheria terrae TaxID=1597781 RepID=UPI00263A5C0B|nr:phosphoethanolamine--lipid A transferase [Eleftheria terrae]WKB53327.1 phosphoethanolamine--lipid A transferase [Eleftheria terrae]
MPSTPTVLRSPARWPALALRLPGTVSTEALAFAASLYFTLFCNRAFWHGALDGRSLASLGTWAFAVAVAAAITLLQFAVLCAVLTRHGCKPVLALLLVATACANHFTARYGVVLDPGMLRNVLRTDWKEARELLSAAGLADVLLQTALPLWLLSQVRLARHGLRQAALRRLVALLAALLGCTVALMCVFQDVAALMRNHKALRYQITPGNYVYSLGRAVWQSHRAAAGSRQPIGTDARLGATALQRSRPALLVLVVGETVRGANWGLNGYRRNTTPELAGLDVVNFPQVSACGTNTEVSLPCMFSPWGRHAYDEERILGHESLLHLLHRAGLQVHWRDNQSGCKGVCDGLPIERLDRATLDGLCHDGLCLDEVLLHGLGELVRDARGNLVLVLHQLGNHGPAYFKRYPPAFRHYTPTCDTADLRECSQEQIVNSYDNAVRYTDHVVAEAIRFLQAQSARYDTALIYLSDHGESLGENQLYLHGLPYLLAPAEQTRVPMVFWLSPGWRDSTGLDLACLRARAARPASHDHLFHTVLGLLNVETRDYDAGWDLTAGCRSSGAATAPATPASVAPVNGPAAALQARPPHA